uniref:(California timema) hypothetical protein n=1 Tax=Timema californicum TaxID=61474 RepID=A0A7R9JK66_TIMCA|nr:unnamed protein product [Timema californicum]
MFSMQLLHRKVRFTACGFFPLDYTLLYSVRHVGWSVCMFVLLMLWLSKSLAQ